MFRRALSLSCLLAFLLVSGCAGGDTTTVTRTQVTTATVTTPPSSARPATVRVQDDKAKDDARKAVGQLDLCHRDAGTFQGCKGTGIPRNVELADLTSDGYQVTAESESGDTFTATRSSSGTTRTCSPPGSGGCPARGTW